VRHRNNLGFRTANPIVFGGTPVTLNFTNNSVALQNSSLTLLKPNLYAMSAGDANADGSVDSFDSIDWEFQNGLFNNPYTLNADYNLDGSVDAFDSILWEFSNGKFQELD
jgi:hypothetical protein